MRLVLQRAEVTGVEEQASYLLMHKPFPSNEPSWEPSSCVPRPGAEPPGGWQGPLAGRCPMAHGAELGGVARATAFLGPSALSHIK